MGCVLRSFVVLLAVTLCLMRRGTSNSISEDDNDVRGRREGGDDSQSQTVESELADLHKEVELLKSALRAVETAVWEPRGHRTSRSITPSENSGSIQIESCLYGNFTCRGDPGPMGPPGRSGRDGRDGRDGVSYSGQDAPSAATERPSVRPGSGAYVRWGRTTCPRGSQLVYEGVIGGSHYDHRGSGANYLCLPLQPIYDSTFTVPGVQDLAFLYGAEYAVWSPFNSRGWRSSRLNSRGPPCAVCLAQERPTVIMVPARNVCPSSDWTLDYRGKLMSERNHFHRTEYICVDDYPQAVPGTVPVGDGVLLHPVEGRCLPGNSLPCGPYVDGHELTCAVCSQ